MARRNTFDVAEQSPKQMTEREKEWLDEVIEVEFMNLEEPGLMMKFSYGTTKNLKNYTLMHGGKYQLPRSVVKHIESRQTPIWNWRPDGQGSMQKSLVGYQPRFNCRQTFA